MSPALQGLWELRSVFLWMLGVGASVVVLRVIANLITRLIDQARFRGVNLSRIDRMTGEEFERYLVFLFGEMGYRVEHTGRPGDFGVDLVLIHPQSRERIAVQAKRYRESIDISAVQQVHLGRTMYECHSAWVVGTASFTPAARTAAKAAGVRLIDRTALAETIARVEWRR